MQFLSAYRASFFLPAVPLMVIPPAAVIGELLII